MRIRYRTPKVSVIGMQVDLWSVALEASPELVAHLAEVLSAQERVRADRFATPALRRRYVIAHAALRSLLGSYLTRDPASIELDAGSGGKPFVKDRFIDFNLSHSGELAVYAFARGRDVGVDVEWMRDMPGMLDIARSVFSPNEHAQLTTLDPRQRTEAFFRCWTRKEAYLKAVGEGIVAPLDDFEVTLRADEAPAIRHISGDRAAAAQWVLYDFVPHHGYLAALAVKGAADIAKTESPITAEELANASLLAMNRCRRSGSGPTPSA